jgi:putative endonuclease
MEKNLTKPFDLFRFGEEEACRFLKKNGCKIVDRNYRVRTGEIDIVARRGKTMLFVEVKTRASSAFAQPYEAVGFRKRKSLKAAAKYYVQERNIRDLDFRFDVISITLNDAFQPQLEWMQGAF